MAAAIAEQVTPIVAHATLGGPWQAVSEGDRVFLGIAYNTGLVMGIGSTLPGPWREYLVVAATLLAVLWILADGVTDPLRSRRALAGRALWPGGTLGNAADRLQYGAVLDFIGVRYGHQHFFFNVADLCVLAALWWYLWEES